MAIFLCARMGAFGLDLSISSFRLLFLEVEEEEASWVVRLYLCRWNGSNVGYVILNSQNSCDRWEWRSFIHCDYC